MERPMAAVVTFSREVYFEDWLHLNCLLNDLFVQYFDEYVFLYTVKPLLSG